MFLLLLSSAQWSPLRVPLLLTSALAFAFALCFSMQDPEVRLAKAQAAVTQEMVMQAVAEIAHEDIARAVWKATWQVDVYPDGPGKVPERVRTAMQTAVQTALGDSEVPEPLQGPVLKAVLRTSPFVQAVWDAAKAAQATTDAEAPAPAAMQSAIGKALHDAVWDWLQSGEATSVLKDGGRILSPKPL